MTETEEIQMAFRRITHAIDVQSRRLMRQSGLTAPQWMAMQIIERNGALSAGALAQQMTLSQATITSLLTRLERAGLVRRERGARDRRIVMASLTPAGQAKLGAAPQLLHADFMARFTSLADWERNMVISALQRIAEIMSDAVPSPPAIVSGETPIFVPSISGEACPQG